MEVANFPKIQDRHRHRHVAPSGTSPAQHQAQHSYACHHALWMKIRVQEFMMEDCVDEDLRYKGTHRRTFVETKKSDTKVCMNDVSQRNVIPIFEHETMHDEESETNICPGKLQCV